MWVESEEGKGSTFYVSIFARGSMQESSGVTLSPEQALRRAATPVTGKRALLVGGRETFQRMVGSMLRVWGLEVSVAASADELHSVLGSVEKGRAHGQSNGRKLVRVDVSGSHGKPFDVVFVDCFDTVKRSKNGKRGAVDGGSNGRTMAADLVGLCCQLAERVPTFLLTSKDTKGLISTWANMVRDP